METLQGWILPPTAHTIVVAKFIIISISLLFVSYISVLFGSVLCSLGFSFLGNLDSKPHYQRFARDIAETFIPRPYGIIALTILPLMTIGISFAQILYGTVVPMLQYFVVTIGLSIPAIILSILYRRSFEGLESNRMFHHLLGLGAIGAIVLTVFAFVSSVTIATFPEKWPRIQSIIPLTYDWNMLWRFKHVLMAGLALTGASILFFFFSWSGGKKDVEGDYGNMVRNFGGGLALGFTLLQTVFFILYLATLPEFAKSMGVYYIGLFALFVLLIASVLLANLLRDKSTSNSTSAFIMILVFLMVVLVGENAARENTLVYQADALEQLFLQKQQQIDAIRAERGGGGQGFGRDRDGTL